MDTTEKQQESAESRKTHGSRAALERMYLILGEALDAFGHTTRWEEPNRPLIYNVQLRAPIREGQDVLMLIKAVLEGEPVIAFHSDRTMKGTIMSWADRLNAGRVVWKVDEYPPRNFEEIQEYVYGAVEYHQSRWGVAP